MTTSTESKRSCDSREHLVDFERASLTWVTLAGSVGRWRLACCATVSPSGIAQPESYFLALPVVAGHVYGSERLPHDPAYMFAIVVGPSKHTIWRDYEASTRDTTGLNTSVFERLGVDAPAVERRRVDPSELSEHGEPWPLFGVLTIASNGGIEWRLEFPIAHINHRDADGGRVFQVETGPLIIPGSLLPSTEASIVGGFALAYALFNKLDSVDLVLFRINGQARHFCGFARLEGIHASVFA